jgi:lipoate-protein ligase A
MKALRHGRSAFFPEFSTTIMPASPAKIWRLIITPPLPGAENMAIDEALLRSFDPATSLPLLRLYGWDPPALSLGRFQKAAEVLDLEHCRADGVPVVRRVTGGGVIYHADEMTYSLVCSPAQIPPAASIKDSFRVLTSFLLSFYRSLGIDAAYALDTAPEGSRLGERTPFCFAGKESFDILANGRKIGGNAQRRLKGVIFQHGSIPLQNRAVHGLTYMRDQSPEHAAGAASLAEFDIRRNRDDLLHALTAAFGSSFGVTLQRGELTGAEQVDADTLRAGKYCSDQWNLEGVEE